MAAILGPGGPSMATKIATNSPGDQLWRGTICSVTCVTQIKLTADFLLILYIAHFSWDINLLYSRLQTQRNQTLTLTLTTSLTPTLAIFPRPAWVPTLAILPLTTGLGADPGNPSPNDRPGRRPWPLTWYWLSRHCFMRMGFA